MDKESVVNTHSRVLLSHRDKGNYVICRKTGGMNDHYVKSGKPDSGRQISVLSQMWNLDFFKGYESRRETIWVKEADQWEEEGGIRESNGR
jgi:hypothetical protein